MFGKRRFGHDICCHVNDWHEVLPNLLLCFIYDFFGGGGDTAPTTLRHKEWANSLSLVAVRTPHLLPSGTGNGANSLSLVAVGTPHLLPSDTGNRANSFSLVAVRTPHLLPSDTGNGANSLSLVAVGTPHLLHKGKLSRCSVSLHPHPADKEMHKIRARRRCRCVRDNFEITSGAVWDAFGITSGCLRDNFWMQHDGAIKRSKQHVRQWSQRPLPHANKFIDA